jgi:hypothetical protein
MIQAAALLLLWPPLAGPGPEAGPPLPPLVLVQQHGKASLWVQKRRRHPLTLGLSESLTVVVRVDADEPVEVEELQALPKSDALWVQVIYQPPAGTETRHWHKVYRILPLKPETHELRLPALRYGGEGGDMVMWEPLTARVTTRVAKVDPSEARDITPPEELPVPPTAATASPAWPWLLAAAPLVLLAAAWLLRRRARRLPTATPRDIVVRHLDELQRQAVADPDDARRWHLRLSDLLRWYLEKQLHLPATRQTTAEFFRALELDGKVPPEQEAGLNAILSQCDLVKFAGVVPPREDWQKLVEKAKEFVTFEIQTNHRVTEDTEKTKE